MVAINKHSGSDDPSTGKFDHVAQAIRDIRELRDRHDREKQERHAFRFSTARLVRSAKVDIPLEEALPLFLSTPDNQDSQSTDQDAPRQDPEHQDSLHQEEASERDCLDQASECQEPSDQETGHQDEPRHQDVRHQNSRRRDGWHQEGWQQAALEFRPRAHGRGRLIHNHEDNPEKEYSGGVSPFRPCCIVHAGRSPHPDRRCERFAHGCAAEDVQQGRPGARTGENRRDSFGAGYRRGGCADSRGYCGRLSNRAARPADNCSPANPADPDEAATLQKRAHDGDVLFKQFQAWEAAQSAKAAGRAAQ